MYKKSQSCLKKYIKMYKKKNQQSAVSPYRYSCVCFKTVSKNLNDYAAH